MKARSVWKLSMLTVFLGGPALATSFMLISRPTAREVTADPPLRETTPVDCGATRTREFERRLLAITDYTEARITVDRFVGACVWNGLRLVGTLDSKDVEYRAWRGAANEDLGEVPSAVMEYCEALRLEPTHSAVSARVAALHAKGGPSCEEITDVAGYLREHRSGLPMEQRDPGEFARRQGFRVAGTTSVPF